MTEDDITTEEIPNDTSSKDRVFLGVRIQEWGLITGLTLWSLYVYYFYSIWQASR